MPQNTRMVVPINSFMSWVGGKMRLRDSIVERFPLGYEKYIEVFGGAARISIYTAGSCSSLKSQ